MGHPIGIVPVRISSWLLIGVGFFEVATFYYGYRGGVDVALEGVVNLLRGQGGDIGFDFRVVLQVTAPALATAEDTGDRAFFSALHGALIEPCGSGLVDLVGGESVFEGKS